MRDEGEACDDGNRTDGDGCEANCTLSPKPDPCTDEPLLCRDVAPHEPDEEPRSSCRCSGAPLRIPMPGFWLGLALVLVMSERRGQSSRRRRTR